MSSVWLGLAAATGCSGCGGDASVLDASPGPTDAGCEPLSGEPELALELLAEGFNRPVHVAAPAGDVRLFVLEQHTGKVWVVSGDQVLAEPFLDLSGEVSRAFEQGLLSLVFHPDYHDNGRFFVTYTRPGDDLVLESWLVSENPDRANPGSREELLVVEQPTNFHNGGGLAFGPDGYLYVGLGDGGPMHDPEGNAQDLGKLLGKFIRIDVDRPGSEAPYSIPADNPFIEEPGARPEIWVLGVRNPWSFSFDAETGALYFGDVGLARWEEINVIPAGGANFGWPIMFGGECIEEGCEEEGLVPPIHRYPYATQERCAVIGGHVYRGCRMPGHHGRYFFTDFCAAFVHSFEVTDLPGEIGEVVEHETISGVIENASALGVDGLGELLLVDWDAGRLYRIVPGP